VNEKTMSAIGFGGVLAKLAVCQQLRHGVGRVRIAAMHRQSRLRLPELQREAMKTSIPPGCTGQHVYTGTQRTRRLLSELEQQQTQFSDIRIVVFLDLSD